jgi:hypothetical protein
MLDKEDLDAWKEGHLYRSHLDEQRELLWEQIKQCEDSDARKKLEESYIKLTRASSDSLDGWNAHMQIKHGINDEDVNGPLSESDVDALREAGLSEEEIETLRKETEE